MTEASIIVPSRGGAKKLPILFQSLASQSITDWEAIIVLDGDVDNSAAVVDEWAVRLPVRRLTFPENRGRAAALSAGFAEATGRVLIRCDDDLELHPDHVANHVAHHTGPPVGIVGLCIDVFPEGNVYATVYGQAANESTYVHARDLPADQTWRSWAANVSVTRETYNRVGPYDTSFREYGWEDVEWGYRLYKLGVPVIVAIDVEARHHSAAVDTWMRASRAFYSGRARSRFEAKHGAVYPAAPPGKRAAVWNTLVAGLAMLINERNLPRLCSVADRAIPVLPRYVATKVVAATVEAADRAGRRPVSS